MKVLYKHPMIKHRWMTSLGVQISSEKKMRKISKELIGENLAGEATPFYFSTKHGIDILPAPHVYIPDLVAKVFEHLEQNERLEILHAKNMYGISTIHT